MSTIDWKMESEMPAAAIPSFKPGKVYRTQDLKRFGRNAPRLAKRLVAEGHLRPVARGLFVHPEVSKFGPVPPTREALMRAYLNGGRFLFSGPEQWNALGLGSTALFASQLVYNTTRSGEVALGRRRFVLRRVAFPKNPSAEYFVIDLLKNHRKAGVPLGRIVPELTRAVATGRLSRTELREQAALYGTTSTQRIVESAIVAAPIP